jgi:ankyrin repeat protein
MYKKKYLKYKIKYLKLKGGTKLSETCKNRNVEDVKLLFDTEPSIRVQINDKDEDGLTPLFIAIEKNDIEMAKLLIENGADVNMMCPIDTISIEGPVNIAPLHNAKDGYEYHKDMITLLIDNGADVNVEDSLGKTPIELAHEIEDDAAVKLFFERGAFISADKATTLMIHHLYRYGRDMNIDTIRLLLEHGADVHSLDIYGNTPLIRACKWCNEIDLVTLLLSKGATEVINTPDNEGFTPLHYACRNYCVDTVTLLLNNYADVNFQNADGNTPLHLVLKLFDSEIAKEEPKYEIIEQYNNIIKLLIENNTIMNIPNNEGKTPTDIIILFGGKINTENQNDERNKYYNDVIELLDRVPYQTLK